MKSLLNRRSRVATWLAETDPECTLLRHNSSQLFKKFIICALNYVQEAESEKNTQTLTAGQRPSLCSIINLTPTPSPLPKEHRPLRLPRRPPHRNIRPGDIRQHHRHHTLRRRLLHLDPRRRRRGLEHTDIIQIPILLGKRSRILRDKAIAALGTILASRHGAAVSLIHCTGPVAAEGSVEDDAHVVEHGVDGAGALEEGGRGAEICCGVGVAGADGVGDCRAGEEPYFDGRGGPVHGVDAAALGVEARAVACCARVRGGAACRAEGHGAVVGLESGGLAGARDGAAGFGVRRDQIGADVVDAFEDVELARLWPGAGLAQEPEGRPTAAGAVGHVLDVGDEEAVVVAGFGGEADGFAAGACRRQDGVLVDAPVCDVGLRDKAGGEGGVVVDVGDEAVGGVCGCEEVELAEEVAGSVGLCQTVCLGEA